MTSSITALLLRHKTALLITLLALILRLFFVLILEPSPNFKGGDANWYMFNGRELVTTGKTPGPIQTGPVYPVVLGIVQVLTPGESSGLTQYTHAEMQIVRLMQSDTRRDLVLVSLHADPPLILSASGHSGRRDPGNQPGTDSRSGQSDHRERVYLFRFRRAGILCRRAAKPHAAPVRWSGYSVRLATLTRAIFLLFPLGLALYLFFLYRARAGRMVLALIVSYGSGCFDVDGLQRVTWERLVIGGEGLLSFVYQGATDKASPEDLDAELGITPDNAHQQRNEAMREGIEENVLKNPFGWAKHRVRELAEAYLQPHNTNRLKGKSLRAAASTWARKDRSINGLIDLTQINSFWPKLALYIFHFGGLMLGTIGMWITRRQWRSVFAVYGIMGYFTGIHLILLALPRYLFPVYPAFWIFAAAVIVMVWDRRS